MESLAQKWSMSKLLAEITAVRLITMFAEKMQALIKTQKKKLFMISPAILLLVYTLSYIYWRSENLRITTESQGVTAQDDVTICRVGGGRMKMLFWPAVFLEFSINDDVDIVGF